MRAPAAMLLLALVACKDDSPTTDSQSPSEVDVDQDGFTADVDCDDEDASVNPDAEEVCDGLDNDCDGDVDGGAIDAGDWYSDGDGDGFGGGDPTTACDAPSGAVTEGGDCDDADPAFYPGAPEDDCTDPNDYNCDGSTGYADNDGDGFPACEDCNDELADVNPDASEVCDSVDNDCDGLIDDEDDSVDVSTGITAYADADGDGYGDLSSPQQSCEVQDGYSATSDDCDDGDPSVNPAASEICDDVDNDCDGLIDDNDDSVDVSTGVTSYADADGDGFGDASSPLDSCEVWDGYSATGDDCDDGDSSVNPGATEVCDGVDNDCNGDADGSDATDQSTWYDDNDGDGYGDASASSMACDAPSGTVSDSTDCDDADASSNPGGTEVCDGADNDCNGTVDDLSSGATCTGTTCLDWLNQGYTTSGVYAIDPEASGTGVDAYCDMDSDGGGWTLVTWTEDSTQSPLGVPYPSLAECSTLDCVRGSAGDVDMLTALIDLSGEIGVGHTTTAISLYQDIEDYEYSGKIDYGSLSGFYLDPYNQISCDNSGFATGTFTSISGPNDYDGTTLYLAQSFRYTTSYGDFDENSSYIWMLGTTSGYCGGSGTPPAVYLGNWSTSEREYGPYVSSTAGARAVYVR